MLHRFKKGIKNPRRAFLYILGFKIFRIIPDRFFLKIKYRLRMKEKLSLKSPRKFNEKIQWLKLYDRKPEYTMMVDKYEVRKYISERLGEEYLIPLLGVWDSFEEIDFDRLPNQFVLKPNHTSGNVYICKDKTQIDYEQLKKEINSWMKRKYYWLHREWPYKNVKPRIICEQYMEDESVKELRDYKFMCFNGKVRCSFVGLNRNSPTGLNVDFYDIDWNPMPFERLYPNSGKKIPKPKNYNKMIQLAEVLSRNISFVRIDFYEVNGQIYFGEITFYPGSGFEGFSPESFDYLLGSWIRLPYASKKR